MIQSPLKNFRIWLTSKMLVCVWGSHLMLCLLRSHDCHHQNCFSSQGVTFIFPTALSTCIIKENAVINGIHCYNIFWFSVPHRLYRDNIFWHDSVSVWEWSTFPLFFECLALIFLDRWFFFAFKNSFDIFHKFSVAWHWLKSYSPLSSAKHSDFCLNTEQDVFRMVISVFTWKLHLCK